MLLVCIEVREPAMTHHSRRLLLVVLMIALSQLACAVGFTPPTPGGSISIGEPPTLAPPSNVQGEQATVSDVIDGDTIDVLMNGVGYRVRYVGVNTPERDETCYSEATNANAGMVAGQTITMTRDQSNTDRYGRLLRYIYVGNVFVNEQLVIQGYAEAVEYQPDTLHTAYFRDLEVQARNANVGCHPSGIFNDGSTTR